MAKKKPSNGYWNYRLVTYVETYTIGKGLKEETNTVRMFGISECYYDKNDKLEGYSEKENFYEWESVKDIKKTYKYISTAFKKPIIDLDNFPNEYIKRIIRKRNNT